MSVTLHTTLGDIKIEVFCESVPKTAEVSLSFFLLHFLSPSLPPSSPPHSTPPPNKPPSN